jgi:hypothetical protein
MARKGSKPDAPGARKVASRRAARGKKKTANRPGPSGTGSKKQARGSSVRIAIRGRPDEQKEVAGMCNASAGRFRLRDSPCFATI